MVAMRLTVALLLGTLASVAMAQAGNNASTYDAIVVGAGVSGLAAASALTERGYKVLVLEGRDRLGGRMHTVPGPDGVMFELGAQWIHGWSSDNPLYPMVTQNKWKTVPGGNDVGATFYADTGKPVPKDIEDKWDSLYDDLSDELGNDPPPSASVQSVADKFAKDQELSAADKIGLQYELGTNLEQEFAADASQLSAANFDDGEELTGEEDAILTGGYNQVTNLLASKVGAAHIRTGTTVSRVEHDAKARSVKVTASTPSGPQTFSGRFAVVTVPLGVLKQAPPAASAITFSPALPASKAGAVSRLGMGTLDKVMLLFDKPYTGKDAWIRRVGAPGGRLPEFYSLGWATGKPAVVGFNAGSVAVKSESESNATLVNAAVSALHSIYGPSGMPAGVQPRQTIVTRWAQDKFSYGSYSYHAVGSKGLEDRAALAAPLAPVLYFAGEACDDKWPSTVHGAYRSGQTAAAAAVKDNPRTAGEEADAGSTAAGDAAATSDAAGSNTAPQGNRAVGQEPSMAAVLLLISLVAAISLCFS